MTFRSNNIPRTWWLVACASSLSAGCLAPTDPATPCPPAGEAPGAATAATGAADAPAASTPAPVGKLTVWDGDGVGPSAKGWCEKRPLCSLDPAPDSGHAGVGLKYHAEGPEWLGFGWNWFGWWPKDAGTDITQYKNLNFWIRVQGKSDKEGPDPKSVQAQLACSKTEKLSKGVPVADYVSNFADGQWHEVTIPVAEFLKGEGAEFDPKSTWEFRIGTWASDARNFEIYFDDIGFN